VQVQGCVVGRGVVLGAGANLRECQVAPGTVVPPGAEHRAESVPRVR
jgi:carbonic anhydrase/acetyltransferase-like protein (isoleucine patch superfamily)